MQAAQADRVVLIVDDSQVARLITRALIETGHPGWIVEEAASGLEALAKAQTCAPSLILLDVGMPGMDGLTAGAQLRQHCRSSHISLLTASVHHAVRRRAHELGMGCMQKPVTAAAIRQLFCDLEEV